MKKIFSNIVYFPAIAYFFISLYIYIDGCTCSGFVCDILVWIVAWPWSIWWQDSYVINDWDMLIWGILKDSRFYGFVHLLPLLVFVVLNTVILFLLGKMISGFVKSKPEDKS